MLILRKQLKHPPVMPYQHHSGDDDGVVVVGLDERMQQLVPDDGGLSDAPAHDFYVVPVLVCDDLPSVRCVHCYVILAHCAMLV